MYHQLVFCWSILPDYSVFWYNLVPTAEHTEVTIYRNFGKLCVSDCSCLPRTVLRWLRLVRRFAFITKYGAVSVAQRTIWCTQLEWHLMVQNNSMDLSTTPPLVNRSTTLLLSHPGCNFLFWQKLGVLGSILCTTSGGLRHVCPIRWTHKEYHNNANIVLSRIWGIVYNHRSLHTTHLHGPPPAVPNNPLSQASSAGRVSVL